LAHHHKEYNGPEIKEACAKAFDLLKDDGTARAYKRSGVKKLCFWNSKKISQIGI